jgi:SHS2 domain-containing protein
VKQKHYFIDHTADILFRCEAPNLNGLFVEAALAVQECMAELETVDEKISREFKVEAKDVESLLFDFLDELLLYKDSEILIFKSFTVSISEHDGKYILRCIAKGEEFNHEKHERKVDVKAITMHMFEVKKTEQGWKAQVLVDI